MRFRFVAVLAVGGCLATPELRDDTDITCDFQVPGIVTYLTLDQIQMGMVLDASPKHTDGTITGALSVDTGRVGNAVRWDAQGQYIDLGSGPAVDQLLAVTACMWIRPDTSGDHMTLLDKTLDGISGGWNMYLAYGSSTVGLGFGNRSGVYEETVPMIMRNSAWVHVCATWDGGPSPKVGNALEGIHLWIDANDVAPSVINEGRRDQPASDAQYPLRVGSGAEGGPNYTYRGLMDEVLIFDRVLDGNEIAAVRECAP